MCLGATQTWIRDRNPKMQEIWWSRRVFCRSHVNQKMRAKHEPCYRLNCVTPKIKKKFYIYDLKKLNLMSMTLERRDSPVANVKTIPWFKLSASSTWISNVAVQYLIFPAFKETEHHTQRMWLSQSVLGSSIGTWSCTSKSKHPWHFAKTPDKLKSIWEKLPSWWKVFKTLCKKCLGDTGEVYNRERGKWPMGNIIMRNPPGRNTWLRLCRSKKWTKDLSRETCLRNNGWKQVIMMPTIYQVQS